MNTRRQRSTMALGAVAVVTVGLLLLGFGTGWLALTNTPRPVGRLRPADLKPALSSLPIETAEPLSTLVSTPTTQPPTETLVTAPESRPSTTSGRPTSTAVPPATTHRDDDHDADD
jgi:hypothetical protein